MLYPLVGKGDKTHLEQICTYMVINIAQPSTFTYLKKTKNISQHNEISLVRVNFAEFAAMELEDLKKLGSITQALLFYPMF